MSNHDEGRNQPGEEGRIQGPNGIEEVAEGQSLVTASCSREDTVSEIAQISIQFPFERGQTG